jgi:hypothetical protein
MKTLLHILSSALLCLHLILPVQAHEAHTEHSNEPHKLAVSVAMDAKQQLWRASVQDGFVMVAKSTDLGNTFSAPVKVNAKPMKVAARGEARPKIALANNGNIYLTWTESLKKRFAGYVWFARSVDGGKTFEKPFIVHKDRAKITHRYDVLSVSGNGKITVAWVDKRDLLKAKAAGKPYTGGAIYYAVSSDAGKTFAMEQKLADSSCECCRIAMTTKPDGTAVAMWRHVFEGGERDHMMGEVPTNNAAPVLHRATFGSWKIDGCPHHGAAIARGGEGDKWWGYHMAYFDGKDKKPGLYYTRMDGEAWASFPAKKFGNHAKQAAHPALWSRQDETGEHLWRVWRELDQKEYQILGQYSDDGGRSWQDPNVLMTAVGKVDYPQLVGHGHDVHLVWNTKALGLVVKKLSTN